VSKDRDCRAGNHILKIAAAVTKTNGRLTCSALDTRRWCLLGEAVTKSGQAAIGQKQRISVLDNLRKFTIIHCCPVTSSF